MKIILLCGSLERGRDGVGDYTTRLAYELMQQGHKVGILALNDQFLKQEMYSITKFESPMSLTQLRLPSIWSIKKRFEKAKGWIDSFNPDWISLQFVIFSFHPKGLPFGLSKQLLILGGDKRWHIMFHELWVGMEVNATIKYKLWGWLQRNIIRKVLLDIKPRIIHTQSRIFQAQLNRLGFNTGYLPLFGNIPNLHVSHHNKSEDQINSDNIIRLIHFASVRAGAPIDEFAWEVARYSREKEVVVSLTFIGRSGPEKNRWIEAFKSQSLIVESLGELSPESISEYLSTSTMGISSTPIVLADKSGSVAAMREHGLPVLCVTYPWQSPIEWKFEPIPGVFQYRNGIFNEIVEAKKKYNDDWSAVLVASKLAGYFAEQMNFPCLIG